MTATTSRLAPALMLKFDTDRERLPESFRIVEKALLSRRTWDLAKPAANGSKTAAAATRQNKGAFMKTTFNQRLPPGNMSFSVAFTVMPRPPSLRDVAARAGVGATAASLALRHHPRIPKPTRDRVLAAAHDLGYRPPAIYREAMARIRQGRRASDRDILAWVTAVFAPTDPTSASAPVPPHETALFEPAQRAAHEQGYHFEPFLLGTPDLPLDAGGLATLRRRLVARGIRGAFVQVLGPGLGVIAPDHFAGLRVVTNDEGAGAETGMARVIPDHAEAVSLAMLEISRLGYRRPGLLFHRWLDKRQTLRNTFLALRLRLGMDTRVPPLHFRPMPGAEMLLAAWRRRHRPDCILYMDDSVPAFLGPAGRRPPDAFGLVHLTKRAGAAGSDENAIAGPEIDPAALARAATLLLVSSLEHGDGWDLARANTLLISPAWRPGRSLAAKPASPTRGSFRGPFIASPPGRHPRFVPIPLHPCCNRSFAGQEPWFGQHAMPGIPPGTFTAAGVPFTIPAPPRQFILMASASVKSRGEKPLPPRVRIPLPASAARPARLFFLHACAYAERGAPFAAYRFLYADGTALEQPIACPAGASTRRIPGKVRSNAIVHDWWYGCPTFASPNVKPVRLHSNDFEEISGGHLYVWRWDNPHPAKRLAAIEILSQPTRATALGLIGLTATAAK